jgi:hypothetical protein
MKATWGTKLRTNWQLWRLSVYADEGTYADAACTVQRMLLWMPLLLPHTPAMSGAQALSAPSKYSRSATADTIAASAAWRCLLLAAAAARWAAAGPGSTRLHTAAQQADKKGSKQDMSEI